MPVAMVQLSAPSSAGGVRLEPVAIGGAQRAWAATALGRRLGVVRAFRHVLAGRSERFTGALGHLPRTAVQSLVAEVLPLAAACKYLEREAPRLLRKQRLGGRGRPIWLGRTAATVEQAPVGKVLIIAPFNYPLFLPGVQALQALAAGNAVLLKPGRGGTAAARALGEGLAEAGLPANLLTVLPEDITAVEAALDAGVQKVFLTGSFATGQRVLELLAPRAIPAVVELSGCDAAVLLPGVGHERFVKALRFGVMLNHGQTCISPRRAFVPRERLRAVEAELVRALGDAGEHAVDAATHRRVVGLANQAVEAGARLLTTLPETAGAFAPVVLTDVAPTAAIANEDLFAPVVSLIPYDRAAELPGLVNGSPYALGASVFGPEGAACALAGQLSAPTVTVNDLIAPTADPRLPFVPAPGSRSGFGSTRGPQGLLEMTVAKVTVVRRGAFAPHLEPLVPGDEALFTHLLRASHGRTLGGRVANLFALFRVAARRPRPGSADTSNSGTE